MHGESEDKIKWNLVRGLHPDVSLISCQYYSHGAGALENILTSLNTHTACAYLPEADVKENKLISYRASSCCGSRDNTQLDSFVQCTA